MKYKNVPELDIQPGDKVRFANEKSHEAIPSYSPPAGTIGIVTGTSEDTREVNVLWPEDCGVRSPYEWWTFPEWLAFVSREAVSV